MIVIVPSLINACRPEPLEHKLFIAGVLLIPVFLFAYYLIFKQLLKNIDGNVINKTWIFVCLYTIIILPFFIYKILNITSVYLPPDSYLHLYILTSSMSRNVSFLFYLPFIVIIYIFLRLNYLFKEKTVKIITALLDVFCLLLIAYMGAIYVFSVYTTSDNFDAVFSSIVQLFKGVPLGVDSFTNTYGLYPYFLNIIFKIIGLSVLKCSIVFCILIALSFLLIFFFLKNTVNNKLLVFLGLTSVIFLSNLSAQLYLGNIFKRAEPYYAYLPIRYLFPCLLLFTSSLYTKHKNIYLYIISSVICGLSLLWNFDTGLITTLSWILLNFYSELGQTNISTIFKNITWHAIKISAVMIMTILFFYLYVFIGYGRILDISTLLQKLIIFSNLGFNLLPMPLIHPWNIIVLAYIAGIGISVRAIIEKDITPWTKHVFLLTIMGTGMLLYYQGRSHDATLWGPSFYFFILLTLFLDKILSLLRDNKNLLLEFLSILIASILSLSVILISINVKSEFFILKDTIKNVQADSDIKKIIEMNCDFIKKHASPSEKIIIISRNSGTYFSKILNISAFNPGISELYSNSDYERLEKIIAQSDVKVFAENYEEISSVINILKTMTTIDSDGHLFFLKK